MRCSLCTWVVLFGAGCGLLEVTQGITISMQPQDFPFSVDVTQARSQIEEAIEQELGFDLSGLSEIPAQVCDSNNICVNVPAIQKEFTFDVPPQKIDMRDQTELKKYVEAGKVKAVRIKSINFNIETNTLNFELPKVEVYVDDVDPNTPDKPQQVGAIPSLPAGKTGPGKLQFTTQGQAIISDRLLDFAFWMLGKALFSIDKAAGVAYPIPTGKLEGKVQIGVEFTVDPI